MSRPRKFCLDWGEVTRMPNKKELGTLSAQLATRAQEAIRGYEGATLKKESLRIVWEEKGNRHLYGYVSVDWGFGGNPPMGEVARDGRSVKG